MSVLSRPGGELPLGGRWRVRRVDDPVPAYVLEKYKSGWREMGRHATRDRLLWDVERRASWLQMTPLPGVVDSLRQLPARPLTSPHVSPLETWLRQRFLIVDRKPIAITGCRRSELVVTVAEAVRRLNRHAGLPKRINSDRLLHVLAEAGIETGASAHG